MPEHKKKDHGYGAASAFGVAAGGSGAAAAHTANQANKAGHVARAEEANSRRAHYMAQRTPGARAHMLRMTSLLHAGNAGEASMKAFEHRTSSIGHSANAALFGAGAVGLAAHRHAKGKPTKVSTPTSGVAKGASKELVAEAGRGMHKLPGKRQAFARGLKGTYRGSRVAAKEQHGHAGAAYRGAFRQAQGNARANSGHSTSFTTGAKLGHAAHVTRDHPEVTIPAAATAATAGVAAPLAHHAKTKRGQHSSGDTVGKSAFGVEDPRVAKNIATDALKMGKEAMGGLRSAFGSGEPAAAGAAGKSGAQAGSAIKVGGAKLKPLTATPKRAAATGAGAGLGAGLMLNNNGN